MTKDLAKLYIALEAVEHNASIFEKEGRLEEAVNCKRLAQSYLDTIARLER